VASHGFTSHFDAVGLFLSGKVMDWATRKVLAWRVSNTMYCSFCVEALEEALSRYGKAADIQHRSG